MFNVFNKQSTKANNKLDDKFAIDKRDIGNALMLF